MFLYHVVTKKNIYNIWSIVYQSRHKKIVNKKLKLYTKIV